MKQGVSPSIHINEKTLLVRYNFKDLYSFCFFRMGFVTDNCIDWDHFNLPKKSDLQKVLLRNILNRV